MPDIYLSTREHYARVVDEINRNPDVLRILTYSTGQIEHATEIDGEAHTMSNLLGLILERIDQKVESRLIKQCHIIVGTVPSDMSVLTRYTNIKWKIHDSMHAKCWLFDHKHGGVDGSRKVAVVGSRNLVLSMWNEISVVLVGSDCVLLDQYFDTLWKQATDMDQSEDWFSQAKTLLEDDDNG